MNSQVCPDPVGVDKRTSEKRGVFDVHSLLSALGSCRFHARFLLCLLFFSTRQESILKCSLNISADIKTNVSLVL